MLSLKRVEIRPGRMRIYMHLDDGAPRNTDSEIAKRAIAAYPTLPIHSCINSKGPSFGDVVENTSVPHLLEHLIIAEQAKIAKAQGIDDAAFVGTTQWVGECDAVTEISFADDLAAVQALKNAHEFLNSLGREDDA